MVKGAVVGIARVPGRIGSWAWNYRTNLIIK